MFEPFNWNSIWIIFDRRLKNEIKNDFKMNWKWNKYEYIRNELEMSFKIEWEWVGNIFPVTHCTGYFKCKF